MGVISNSKTRSVNQTHSERLSSLQSGSYTVCSDCLVWWTTKVLYDTAKMTHMPLYSLAWRGASVLRLFFHTLYMVSARLLMLSSCSVCRSSWWMHYFFFRQTSTRDAPQSWCGDCILFSTRWWGTFFVLIILAQATYNELVGWEEIIRLVKLSKSSIIRSIHKHKTGHFVGENFILCIRSLQIALET